jgi:hypothetical protein
MSGKTSLKMVGKAHSAENRPAQLNYLPGIETPVSNRHIE